MVLWGGMRLRNGIWICLWVIFCGYAQAKSPQPKTPKTITLPELIKPATHIHPDVREAAATVIFTTTNGGADTNTISHVDFSFYSDSSCNNRLATTPASSGGSISVTNGSTWMIDSVSVHDLLAPVYTPVGDIQSISIRPDPNSSPAFISGDPCPCFAVNCTTTPTPKCVGSTIRSVTLTNVDPSCNF